MAWIGKISRTRYVLGKGKGQRYCRRGTPGARKITEESTHYYVFWYDGKLKKKQTLADTKEKSQILFGQWMAKHKGGNTTSIASVAALKRLPIMEHLEGFVTQLQRKGDGETHVSDRRERLIRLIAGCGFQTIADLAAEPAEKWIAGQKIAGNTKLHYRGAIIAFGNFLEMKDLIPFNPFKKIVRFAGSRERERRALALIEMQKFLYAAANRPLYEAGIVRVGPRKGQPGANIPAGYKANLRKIGFARSLLYRFALYTGLRGDEIRRLPPDYLHLDEAKPHIYLPPGYCKNDMPCKVPLRSDLAAMLHRWCIEFERGREELLFDVPNESKVIERLKKDLAWAGIPYRLPDRRVFDFHAIRHTFKTWLEIAGVQQRYIQLLMRHHDRTVTDLYGDKTMLDLHEAVERLPAIPECRPQEDAKPSAVDSLKEAMERLPDELFA